MAGNPLKVLVVDDLPRVRDALSTLLMTCPDVEVVGMAENGQEAIRLVDELQPDVVLMDMEMPDMDGCTTTRAILADHAVAVVFLTIHTDAASRARACSAGACGFVDKGAPPDQLIQTLHSAGRLRRAGSHL